MTYNDLQNDIDIFPIWKKNQLYRASKPMSIDALLYTPTDPVLPTPAKVSWFISSVFILLWVTMGAAGVLLLL